MKYSHPVEIGRVSLIKKVKTRWKQSSR